MRQWFADIHREHAASAYYQFATEIVKPGDRIITFNYDVSLESCLQRALSYYRDRFIDQDLSFLFHCSDCVGAFVSVKRHIG